MPATPANNFYKFIIRDNSKNVNTSNLKLKLITYSRIDDFDLLLAPTILKKWTLLEIVITTLIILVSNLPLPDTRIGRLLLFQPFFNLLKGAGSLESCTLKF